MNLTEEQILFVKNNLAEIADLKALLDAYIPVVQKRLDEALASNIPNHRFIGQNKEWGFYYVEPSHGFQFLFQNKAHPGRGFHAGCWPSGFSEKQLVRAHEAFRALKLEYSPGSDGGWDGCFQTEEEAIHAFCEIAKQLHAFSNEDSA